MQPQVELRKRYRTGRPVTVRPMTRRWISDVPSKMVKILGGVFPGLVSRVYAGRTFSGGALPGNGRPFSTSDGNSLLPDLLPRFLDPRALTEAQRSGDACGICHKRWPRPTVHYGNLADFTPILICGDHGAVTS